METKKMSSEDYQDWSKFRSSNSQQINEQEINLIVELHAKYFNHKLRRPCTCSPKTYNQWISQLNKIYDNGN